MGMLDENGSATTELDGAQLDDVAGGGGYADRAPSPFAPDPIADQVSAGPQPITEQIRQIPGYDGGSGRGGGINPI